jgi:hypothetical protein
LKAKKDMFGYMDKIKGLLKSNLEKALILKDYTVWRFLRSKRSDNEHYYLALTHQAEENNQLKRALVFYCILFEHYDRFKFFKEAKACRDKINELEAIVDQPIILKNS